MHKAILLLLTLLLTVSSCKEEDQPYVSPNGNKQYGEPFEELASLEDVVVYEVNLRAFSQKGDLQGVIDRLPEIKSLKVNVIWLMPIYPIGDINSVNSPYSVKNYKEVGDEYGTLEDLRLLVEAAHELDMAVILDWVANHTAWDNPWIDSTDWYSQDGNGNIIHPPGTNWQDVADLDFSNQNMRLAMIEAMEYWLLEANIDGFRCDAADFVPFSFWQEAINALDKIPDRDFLFLAEGANNDHHDAGFDLIFGWDFYGKLKGIYDGEPAGGIVSRHVSEYSNVPESKHILRFSTNHDESAWDATPIALFGSKDGAMGANVITTFLGGVPLIYSSQEVARSNPLPFFSNDPINWNSNPSFLQEYKDVMNIYTSSNAAKKGELASYSNNEVVVFKKSWHDEEILVLVNITSSATNYTVPSALEGTTWLDAFDNSSYEFTSTLNLGGFKYRILKS